ncbi:MAG: GNAT family N-acetyltransferase [Pseudomonadota bacterium]
MISVLRPLDPDRDAPSLHAIFGDEASCRFLPRPETTSVEETAALLRGWTDGLEETSWAIAERQDGAALGRVALIPQSDPQVWEAAVMVRPDASGRGLATRAMAEALDFIFTEKNARRIFADIDPDNIASLKVFERLGFQREGYLRAAWRTHIGVRDSVLVARVRG